MTNIRTRKLALIFALTFLLATVFPAAIFADTAVGLHSPHVGADSEYFKEDSDAGDLSDPVVWHFVLNQLDEGTVPALLVVQFENSVTQEVYGQPVGNGSTQHFYVGTPGHDILAGAVAYTESEDGKLVLSHVVIGDLDDDNGNGGDNGDDNGNGGDNGDDNGNGGDNGDDNGNGGDNGDDNGNGEDNGDDVVAGDTGGRGGAPPAPAVVEEEVADIPDEEPPLDIPEEEKAVEEEAVEEPAIEEEAIIEEDQVPLELPRTGDAAAGLIGLPFLGTLVAYALAKKW